MKKITITLLALLTLGGCTGELSETTWDQIEYRDGVAYEINSANPFTGILVEYNLDGNLSLREHYKDGRKDGAAELYHDNGQLSLSVNFKEGKEEGLYEHYFENGQLDTKGNYINGLEDGTWESFYHTGGLAYAIQYKNGKVILPSVYFDKNSRKIIDGVIERFDIQYSNPSAKEESLMERLIIKEGRRIQYENFYFNGSLHTEGNFKNGNKDGVWKIYDGKGKVYFTEIWEEGIKNKE